MTTGTAARTEGQGLGRGRVCRSRPPQEPQPPRDGRRRTQLDDLPEAARAWAAERLGAREFAPVNWLVNRNHCFRASGAEGLFFLKVLRQPDAGERVARERRVLEHLASFGFPAPRFAAAAELEPGTACIATGWIEAAPLRHLDVPGDLAEGYMRELGGIVRELHGALAAPGLAELFGPPRETWKEERVAATARRLLPAADAEFLLQWLPWTRELLAEWPEIPVHGDLQDKNLLLSPEGELYLCDFEGLRREIALVDLCVDRILLKTDLTAERRAALQRQLLEGYGVERARRLLPEAWALMHVDHLALQLGWIEAAGAAELNETQRERWAREIGTLRKELERPKGHRKHRDSPELLPQWYFGQAEVLDSHPGFAPLAEAARAAFPGQPLRVDAQSISLRAGSSIGIPEWQGCGWAAGGALLLVLAAEDLLELRAPDGTVTRVPSGQAVRLDPAASLRFRPLGRAQEASVALARPRAASTPAPLRRESCRVFPPAPEAVPDDWTPAGYIPFNSRGRVVAELPRATTWEEIANEPSISTARIEDALKIGGPLLRRFVAALPEDWRDPDADVVVSVKRNELAPGWSPAPVGWHIDGTHTADRHPDGRANLRNPGNTVEQILCCCGPAAPTRFLLGEIELPEPPLGSKQGQRWQRELEAAADAGRMQRWNAPIDTLVAFGFGDFHTGATAEARGWRCFIKAMRGRGQLTHGGPVERSPVSWPADQPGWPEDPCGIFPDVLP